MNNYNEKNFCVDTSHFDIKSTPKKDSRWTFRLAKSAWLLITIPLSPDVAIGFPAIHEVIQYTSLYRGASILRVRHLWFHNCFPNVFSKDSIWTLRNKFLSKFRHFFNLFLQFVILEAFCPLILIVSYKLSIHFFYYRTLVVILYSIPYRR